MGKAYDEPTAADVMRGDVVAIPEATSLRTRGRRVESVCAPDPRPRPASGEVADRDPTSFWSEWQMVPPSEVDAGLRPATTGMHLRDGRNEIEVV